METDQDQFLAASPWAVRVPAGLASAVAELRLCAGVRAGLCGDDIWLRGDSMNEPLDRLLRRIAPAARYIVSDETSLVPPGCQLPVGELPKLEWLPITELLVCDRPFARLPGRIELKLPLELRRSGFMRPPSLLLARVEDWAEYVHGAPAVRLRPLTFAATTEQVLIRGVPLPPLPGPRLYEVAKIAVPCGWELYPAIDAPSLRGVLALPLDALAVFDADANWQCIAERCFVQASRSAVRLTDLTLQR